MRAYNFVFDITPDFEEAQYRIRPIDFDQQSYEGRKNLYLPQFFKENKPLVTLVQELFNKEVIKQYQSEERTLIATRIKASEKQLRDLLASLKDEPLAPLDKITQLNKEISDFFEIPFTAATTMTEILRKLLQTISDRFAENQKAYSLINTFRPIASPFCETRTMYTPGTRSATVMALPFKCT
jgi:hypothetical protein